MVEHTPSMSGKLDSTLQVPDQVSRGLNLQADAILSLNSGKIHLDVLDALRNQSVIEPNMDKETIVALCQLAAILEKTNIENHKPLDGRLVVTAFFEPSTRTRLSFESSIMRLDGKVISVTDAQVTGIAKGESLEDIGEMLNSYGDLVIMRHTETDSIERMSKNLLIPLINAGNGMGHHPTQALLDWYALLKWRPELAFDKVPQNKKITLCVIGTPKKMRAVKSFISLAMSLPNAIKKLYIVSEESEPFGEELKKQLRDSNIPVETLSDIDQALPEFDAIYMNSITRVSEGYELLDQSFKITADTPLKDGAVVMHPLARRDELDVSLDKTEHNMYFAQAAGAVYMRQAVIICVLGRLGRIAEILT